LALLVVVAAPTGAAPGTMQAVWHAAAWELHAIMQFVTVEVCARRIFPAAETSAQNCVEHPAITANRITTRHMTVSPAARPHHAPDMRVGNAVPPHSPNFAVYAVRM
jgi:hypothetical protein